MENKRIRNIVFDLGNVLINFNPMEYIEKNIPKEKREEFYNTVFPTDEWLMLDRGTLTYEEAKRIFKDRISGVDKEIDRFFDKDFYDMLEPIKKNTALLPLLKKKYKLYILSNFHKDSFEELNRRHEFFRIFDGHVVSCYYHQIKPEKGIYETLINEFLLNPEETVFIDDSRINIEMAEKMGINGIHLPDYDELEKKLENFLK